MHTEVIHWGTGDRDSQSICLQTYLSDLVSPEAKYSSSPTSHTTRAWKISQYLGEGCVHHRSCSSCNCSQRHQRHVWAASALFHAFHLLCAAVQTRYIRGRLCTFCYWSQWHNQLWKNPLAQTMSYVYTFIYLSFFFFFFLPVKID